MKLYRKQKPHRFQKLDFFDSRQSSYHKINLTSGCLVLTIGDGGVGEGREGVGVTYSSGGHSSQMIFVLASLLVLKIVSILGKCLHNTRYGRVAKYYC